MKQTLGLYIHVPFCDSRCYYCDFYSSTSDLLKENYINALKYHLSLWGEEVDDYEIDTIYFGGGTPSCLRAFQLQEIFSSIKKVFTLTKTCEITLEANPEHLTPETCNAYKELGINRISIGVQSSNDITLQAIGRRHTKKTVATATENLLEAGIENFSLDLIGGLPGEDEKDLDNSIAFAVSLKPKHISFYLLKLEEGSVFYKQQKFLSLLDEDQMADLYTFGCEKLQEAGYFQYEISNFSHPGFESKHNNKYWTLEDYLGIGPSAHSMVAGKRFFYPADLNTFLTEDLTQIKTEGDVDPFEYLLLGLRLTGGISLKIAKEQFGLQVDNPEFLKKVSFFKGHHLLTLKGDNLALTRAGFLLSNSVIGELVEALE